MQSTQIAYDTQSGRIISIHHGALNADRAREHLEHYSKIRPKRKISKEHIAIITVPSESFERGKRYKLDVSRKALVEASPGEPGFGFSVSETFGKP